jgi:hypothetical protein
MTELRKKKPSKEVLKKSKRIPNFKGRQPGVAQVHRWRNGKWDKPEGKELPPTVKKGAYPGPGKSLRPEARKLPESGRVEEVSVEKVGDRFHLKGSTGFSVLHTESGKDLLLVRMEKGLYQGLLGKNPRAEVVNGQQVHKFTPFTKQEAHEIFKRLQEGKEGVAHKSLKVFFHK